VRRPYLRHVSGPLWKRLPCCIGVGNRQKLFVGECAKRSRLLVGIINALSRPCDELDSLEHSAARELLMQNSHLLRSHREEVSVMQRASLLVFFREFSRFFQREYGFVLDSPRIWMERVLKSESNVPIGIFQLFVYVERKNAVTRTFDNLLSTVNRCAKRGTGFCILLRCCPFISERKGKNRNV